MTEFMGLLYGEADMAISGAGGAVSGIYDLPGLTNRMVMK